MATTMAKVSNLSQNLADFLSVEPFEKLLVEALHRYATQRLTHEQRCQQFLEFASPP